MTKEEIKIIAEKLPENFKWEDVDYTPMGNFSQLLYKKELVGYITHDNGPEWKPAGMKKN